MRAISSARVVLVIVSPDLLDYIDSHPDVYQLGRILPADRTIAMLCGVTQEDVTAFHRAALVTFDSWPHLIAKDQDQQAARAALAKLGGSCAACHKAHKG